jgi:hypothetical protein
MERRALNANKTARIAPVQETANAMAKAPELAAAAVSAPVATQATCATSAIRMLASTNQLMPAAAVVS